MTITNLLSNVFDPFGLTPAEIGVLGIELTFVGFISSVAVSMIVDKTAKY